MSVTVEKLKAAREFVARPNGWTQGAYGRDEMGRGLDPDVYAFTQDPPCKVCALGALIAAGVPEVALGNAGNYTGEVALLWRAIQTSKSNIHVWNDTPRRTQAEVVAAFDKAIALAEGKL